ncbi:MAG: subclass B3 metallo-beta-lactamase [Alphaproteobacteria bacterium]|nr:subclass B3 metallo-beta-lactamase [Alphaproteobacteria bacterium]
MTTRGVLAAASLIALALPAFGPAPAHAQTQREKWNVPTEPFHIIGNVYYVGTAGLSSFLFVTPEGDILLDAALPESAPQIEANIQKLGFRLSDIKYVLNSHAHFDHSGGLAQIKKDTGAKLVASEGDKSALEGGFYLGSESVKAMSAPPVKVDRVVKDGDALTLGGFTMTAHLTPGHTRGCTSWGWTVEDGGKSYSALDFCSATIAANRLVDPPQYKGIVADYRATFETAAKMKVDVFLAPHAEFYHLAEKRAKIAGGAPNPFIDPGEFQPFIAKQKADFETGLAAQEARAKAKAAAAN